MGQNLEQNQSLHNAYISSAKNISSSNDFTQQQHDMNEHLIRGARLMNEGRSLGLNDDQILQLAVAQQQVREFNDPYKPVREEAQRSRTNTADLSILKELGNRKQSRY